MEHKLQQFHVEKRGFAEYWCIPNGMHYPMGPSDVQYLAATKWGAIRKCKRLNKKGPKPEIKHIWP